MNVTDQIIDDMGKRMAEEMDRQVLWGMFVEIGWTRVTISNETAMVNATAIKEWLSLNCIGPYEKNYSEFIFENRKDASMFILRWV
jgi:hypothetical protein